MEYIDVYSEASGVNADENKITLLNGTELECYPKPVQPKFIKEDNLKLDTTGEYFGLKHKRPKPEEKTDNKDPYSDKRFFLDHAFFFYQNADRILKDSRMFLAPVSIQQGIAYTGTSGLNYPTLGIFLEWWICCHSNVTTNEKGEDALTFSFAGSPLSGSNNCTRIYPDGNLESYHHSSFGPLWGSFMRINRRYTEAKQRYEAYSLPEVYDKLMSEEQSVISKEAGRHFIQETRLLSKTGEWVRKLENLQRQYDSLSKEKKALDMEIDRLRGMIGENAEQ